ncbi:hypothetical protein GALMADRAFT_1269380 [Galerina marginata CBS 339.88]|uniref:Uncharacterized protein n=1 Tax=Galerina marginata (strain CBS 339.88) TaxID=685588 RepID=A0A067TFV6_GALM3|nr:hypothetical protein GALMADRAFT_1269380 [Galerina marginata CBS 339.88]
MMSFQNHFRKAVREGRRSARTTPHSVETKGKSSMKQKAIVIDLVSDGIKEISSIVSLFVQTSLDDSDNEEMPNSRAPLASTSRLNPIVLDAKPEESKVELQQVIARTNASNSATTTRTSPSSSSRSSLPLAHRATRASRTSYQTRQLQHRATPQAGPSSVPRTIDPRIIPVRNFLQACKPSMVHHLEKFQEYGCCSQEHLQNMSEWPQEKKYKELQVLLAIGDVPVVQMDIAMLDGALERYKNRQL